MIELLQISPCPVLNPWLDIVNAIFNGMQMLLLTWLGSRMGHLSHNSDIRLQRDLDQGKK